MREWLKALLLGKAPLPAPAPAPALSVPAPAAPELRDGLYAHWSDVPWPVDRWPDFAPVELACPCCGEAYIERVAIDMLQAARRTVGHPLKVNSAHRCEVHNAHVGGAPASAHKKLAFDVSFNGRDRWALLRALERAGFTTFGFYQTFIHTDTRPGRRWFGNGAKSLWTS